MTAALITDGQLVGLVLLAAAVALCLYAAWEVRNATLVDENEQPIEVGK